MTVTVERPSDESVQAARWQRRDKATKAVVLTALVLGIGILLYPVVMALAGSVLAGAPGSDDVAFSLQGWRAAYADERTYQAWSDSLQIGGATMAIAASLGTLLAWLVSRTNTPGRELFRTALMLPLFIPTVLIGLAWTIGVGSVKRLTENVPVLSSVIPESYSFTGVIVTLSIVVVPLVYLLMLPAFDAMDSTLEDAAAANGIPPWRTALKITVPLAAPAFISAAILAGVRVLETLDIPLMIGRPAGVEVFATRMYQTLFNAPVPNYGKATALGVSLAAVAAVLVLLGGVYVNRRSFVTVAGKGAASRLVNLGRWRFLAAGVCWLYLTIGSIVPVAIVVYGSFEGYVGIWDGSLTLEHWQTAFEDEVFWRSIGNTLLLAFLGAVIMTLLGASAAYGIVRSQSRMRFVLEGLTWVPWAIPGVLLALGTLWGYSFVGGLYGTRWLLLVAYVTIYTPLAVRQFSSAFLQLDPALEYAGWVSGSSKLVTFWRLIRPLLLQTTLASLLLSFVLCVREVSLSAFLVSPGNEVLGVRTLESWTRGGASEAAVYGVCMLLISGVALAVYGLLSRRTRRF
ncbi:ABC transporter permease [Micromonospora inositola]|uniref:Iron(III) transport system permease protein n=1 Tax=Micromonospora inositola TaxID=47865 RepID=A0A1C5K687_9ACTN|nr:iron ABC transporter permease [Micromonospora inositola]SCG77946.1 iron(III) transport system permease protein [Micromonospora inositola]